MKFTKGQHVKFTSKKCIIVATKDDPWLKENDVFGRRKVYPTKDYLLLLKIKDNDYLGEIDVYENQIEQD